MKQEPVDTFFDKTILFSEIENESRRKIFECVSFDDLYRVLSSIGDIQGSQKVYSPGDVKLKIEQIRHGHRDISYITTTFGLRTKVEELLQNDSVHIKYVLNRR